MIKIIIFSTKLIFTLVALILFSSCDGGINFVKGSGNVVIDTRNITQEFAGVAVSGGIEVVVVQSDATSVVVEADDNLINHISTNVIDGVLIISSDYTSFSSNATMKVTVRMPNIIKLTASRGSDLNTLGVIKSDKMDIKAESGSDIQIAIESDYIDAKSSGGSDIEISGIALSLDISTSGGSDIDAKKLMVNDVKAKASGGSSIEIQPILTLDAKSTGGSSIDYIGKPKKILKFEGSGSSVSSR